MDSMTLILVAVQAGVKENVSQAISDAYEKLKELIRQKFRAQPQSEAVLIKYENDPKTWEAPFGKALVRTKADQDIDVIEAAQRVMMLIKPQQRVIGKYNVQISGSAQGFVQGEYNTVTM